MTLKERCEIPAASCIGFYLRRAARAVARLYDRRLAPCGIRGTQFTLLNAVYLSAPVRVQDLAESLGMDRTTLTRNLQPLEKKEWIETESGRDRRTRKISITEGGIEILKKAFPLWEEAQTETEQILGELELENLRSALIKLESSGS